MNGLGQAGFWIGLVKGKKEKEKKKSQFFTVITNGNITERPISAVANIFDIPPVCKDHIIGFHPCCVRLVGSRTSSPCVTLWVLVAFIPRRIVLGCIRRDEQASVRISRVQRLPFLDER